MKKLILRIKSKILGVLVGILAGVILCLTGCGSDKVIQESVRVVETIDEQGNVSGVLDESEIIKNTEEAEGESAEAEGEELLSREIRTVEMISENRDYLQYMSEDEIKALAVEALRAQGLDTSLAEGKLKTRGIDFELPENFFESEEQKGMYITKRYPIDATNILYLEADVDYTLQMMDKEYFEGVVETAFLSMAEQNVDVRITEFTKTKIDGVPSFRVKAEYDMEENHFTHLMYVINGSKTYLLIYTMTHDYDRMDIFEESAATIKVLK